MSVVTLEERLEIGRQRLTQHMLNLAELIFLQVLEEAPDHPVARRLLGVARSKLDNHPSALVDLEAATRLEPEAPEAWSDFAVGLRRAGREAAAGDAWTRAAALRRPHPLRPLEYLGFSSEQLAYAFTLVDYDYTSTVRYGEGRPSHPELARLIGAGRPRYEAVLKGVGEIEADLAGIGTGGSYEAAEPFWLNSWFPALDGAVLTQMLRANNPGRFVEIGSGISTKFARRAIKSHGLRTSLTSIDPQPRSVVDTLCDHVIRKPLERCNPAMFDALEPGDILFLDSSHRTFQGSDVTVFFMEILPRLKAGVIIHVHDIYLPDDYISGHVHRRWNEQYLLAMILLFGNALEIEFPAWFVGQDPALRSQAKAALCRGPLRDLDPYGASFWLRKR